MQQRRRQERRLALTPARPAAGQGSALPKADEGKMPVSSPCPGSWWYLTASSHSHRASSVSFLVFLWVCSHCRLSELPYRGQPSWGGYGLFCSTGFLSGSEVRPPWLAASTPILVAGLMAGFACFATWTIVRHCF